MLFLDVQKELFKIYNIIIFFEKRGSLVELYYLWFYCELSLPKLFETSAKRLILEHDEEEKDKLRKFGQIEDSNEDLYERSRVGVVTIDQFNNIDGQNGDIEKRIPQNVIR